MLARSAAICILLFAAQEAGAAGRIVTWGLNSPAWNDRLAVTDARFGCDSAPAACLHAIAASPAVPRWEIAISTDPSKSAAYAQAYSEASLTEKRLQQIDIDDFVGVYLRWTHTHDVTPLDLLAAVIANTKASNRDLGFGITLYETELT